MSLKRDHLHIVLPEGYKQVLKIVAAKASISMSSLIQQAIDNHLTQRRETHGSKKVTKST